ncbi:MAG: glycoside hydrolase family 18 [Sedimentibacter sp.]|jgi:chitinase|nr:glycoside hydrolase family 18 [Sedimentibacter sp.]
MQKYIKLNYIILVFIGFFLIFYTVDNMAFAKNIKAPKAPVNLEVTEVTESTVTLKWSKPNNSNIKIYKIYKNSTYVNFASATTYTIKDLKPDTEYEFYIRSEAEKSNVSLACEAVKIKTLPSQSAQISSKKIIGYYPAWKSYSGFTPDKLDATKLTHINYAFAYISNENEIKLGYPDKDPENFKKLNNLKEINPNLKILISIGGWNWSGKFSDTASTDASRTAFAESCAEFLVKYGIDGIDLDWEYPVGGGLSTNSKRPQDKQNFTLLLKKIREKLDEQELKDNKQYLLSIAGGASQYYLNNIEPANIKDYVDFVNIMTYDLHGPWDSYSDFNSPLYNKKSASTQYKISVDTSVDLWINAGFPKDKLIVGVPFYGYLYQVNNDSNNGLLQKFTNGKALSYSNIKTNYTSKSEFSRHYDSESMVPWLYGDKTFISYDDEQSMKAKTDYIKSVGLGGTMIWELSQDYNNELLNSIYEGLK